MTTHFVLIDYENVQPKELALLRGGPFKVKLFSGREPSENSGCSRRSASRFGNER